MTGNDTNTKGTTMNATINLKDVRTLNRHLRGFGYVVVIGDDDGICVRVKDCETGAEYPVMKSLLRRLTARQRKEFAS